jgi:hypothetical protein
MDITFVCNATEDSNVILSGGIQDLIRKILSAFASLW